jgi:CHASE2 domain-containing sensor protein
VTTVFISYRRDDASANAGRLCDWLQRQFKPDNVFLDVDKIAPGDDFPNVLQEKLSTADVLVAVIGKAWATIADATGTRRITDPKDFVAREVGTALERGIRVIPVLVGGASMPKAGELPPRLAKLVDCNAIAIDDARFRQDFDNLVDGILGRPRGFARRELDRLQRGMRVLKAGSLIAPAIALVLLFTAWMQVFDFFLLDTRVASYSMWLGERFAVAPPESPVVLVTIDDETEKRLRSYERTAEWRLDHAKLIDRLVEVGVRTIVFDLYFETPSSNEADLALAEAIARAKGKGVPVVVGIRAFSAAKPKMLPALTSAGASTGSLCIGSRLGYAFNAPLAVSTDDKARHERPAANPALGLAAVFPGNVEAIDEERGEVRVRDGGNNRFAAYSVLDFEDNATDCPTLGQGTATATLLLRLSPSGYWRQPARRISYANGLLPASNVPLAQLKGKIALIGVTLREDLHDVVRGWTNEKLYGVELHADTIGNLARGVAVRPLGPTAQWLLMLVLAAAGAALSFVLFDRPAWQRRVIVGGLLLVYAALGAACYLAFDILFNTLYDVAAFAAAYLWLSRLQRKALEPLAEGSS